MRQTACWTWVLPRPWMPSSGKYPGSGKRCLFVNGLFTQHINELTRRESAILLSMLYDQYKDPEVQCRFQWAPGDVAI